MKNKTIIATLGPSSLNRRVIKKMDLLGVDIFRINLSHVGINEFEKTIKMVQNWTGKPVCPDSEGAQLRTGTIENNIKVLKIGKIVKVSGMNSTKTASIIFSFSFRIGFQRY